jgi:hypothetical protein
MGMALQNFSSNVGRPRRFDWFAIEYKETNWWQ